MTKFPPHLLQQIKDRIPLSQIIAPHTRLERKGKDIKACCPFHKEKTPSFHIHDDRQYYHCFGCGAHGDHFSFLTEQEGLSFPEAVERLASIANVALPKADAFEQRHQAIRDAGHHVLELAASWFQEQLLSPQARHVQDYVLSRGLTEQTARQFKLGFAPNNGSALPAFLREKGVSDRLMIDHGLAIKPDQGDLFCRFRDRLIFPIWDRQGKTIGFGGRAMQDGAKAKYLNSPESPLFHKSSVIYGTHFARQAAHKHHRLLMVEGYMDVIALHQAGIEEAVAPMGTALTEEQLRLAWAMTPEPILCLDGDEAGQRAMHRALERALPLLEPGKTLRFASLPAGDDPDSLIQNKGRKAFETLLSQVTPLVEALWHWQYSTHIGDRSVQATPEQKALLEDSLMNLISHIQHDKLKRYYEQDIRQRLFQMSRWKPNNKTTFKNTQGFKPTLPKESDTREYWVMLGILLTYPTLLEQHTIEEQLASITPTDTSQKKLQQQLLDYVLDPQDLSPKEWLEKRGLSSLIDVVMSHPDVIMCSAIQQDHQETEALSLLQSFAQKWQCSAGSHATREAAQRFQQEPSEDQWQILLQQLENSAALED